MELTTLLVAALVFMIVFLWFRRADPSLPPCPVRPLPVVGNLFHVAQDWRLQFTNWRKQCGDIYSLNMRGTLMVILNGYEVIKEAMVEKADIMSDRPAFYVDAAVGMTGKGVLGANGTNWKEQRAVSLSILKAFGMGKNHLAEKIQVEVGCYMKYLASLKGTSSDIHLQTTISTSNVICSILIGHRFEYDDKEFQSLVHKLREIVRDQGNVGLINVFFWLRYIPGDFFKAKKLAANFNAIIEMLKSFVDEKKRHMLDSSNVCNFIDAYIVERNRKIQAGMQTFLDDKNLLKVMTDLFAAGTETASTTIYWCILYMLNYPEVQEKVYLEIKDKVGTDRTPTIQDRSQLTYLNAVITETQRLASIANLSTIHMCSEKSNLKGYTIPKGTIILLNLDSVLHDTATWGDDAMSFRPERFIDDNGKLKIPEQFIPFGIGRRACLGAAMGKMELFLYLSSMFQTFQFLPPNPGSVPTMNYECTAIISPKQYEVRAVERK